MTLTLVKGAKDAPKNVRSSMETLLVSSSEVERWKLPLFQRPLRENDKVRALAEQLKCKDGGCVPGVITLGRLGGSDLWIVDGQHRIHAFKLSGLEEAIIDVRICDFDNVEEMALAFVQLQSPLVRMRPDDVLRGLEGVSLSLQRIRKACPYVGYDQLRRGGEGTGPILSMSGVIRNWIGSLAELPRSGIGSSVELAHALDPEDTKRLIVFLERAHASFGRDPEYYRLWGGLNLTMCMWMWRRIVLQMDMTATSRWTTLTADQFASCLQALTSDSPYLQFLQGKALVDLHRNPCYRHIKRIFAKRMLDGDGKKVQFPQPAWVISK